MIRQSMIKMYVKVVKILLYPNWQLSFSLVSRVRKFYLSVDEKYRQCTGCGMSWFQALGRKLSLAVMKQQSYSCLANNGKRAKWREVFYQSEKDTWGHHTMINNWNPHLKLIIGLTLPSISSSSMVETSTCNKCSLYQSVLSPPKKVMLCLTKKRTL